MTPPILRLAAALTAALLALVPAARAQAEEGAGPGAVLWRAGDRDGAARTWEAALASGEGGARERARLAHNLGVAAHADGDPLVAVAWFTAALRLDPGHADARASLAVARSDAELPPRDGDGLTAAFLSWARGYRRAEAEWLALIGALVLAAAGALEALRGRPVRPVLLGALLAQGVFWAPLLVSIGDAVPGAHMVVEPGGVTVRAMPEPGADDVGRIDAGEVVESLDELPGWRKVRFEGEGRWVRDRGLMALDP